VITTGKGSKTQKREKEKTRKGKKIKKREADYKKKWT